MGSQAQVLTEAPPCPTHCCAAQPRAPCALTSLPFGALHKNRVYPLPYHTLELDKNKEVSLSHEKQQGCFF